ncbi:MAG: DUF4012 domain-containing protein [Candidatus Shapirobacteria bacterium]|jgi:hypothetical protein
MEEIINLAPTVDTESKPVSKQPGQKLLKQKTVLQKILTVLFSIICVLLIIITITGTLAFFFVYVPGKKLYDKVDLAKTEVANLQLALSEKDLKRGQESLVALRSQLSTIESDYKKLSHLSKLPYSKEYYADGEQVIIIAKEALDTGEIIIKAIEPYTDFLGLKGASTDSGKTTEDRIAFLTQSVEGLVPHLKTIEEKVGKIESSLNKIDPNRYPDEYKNIKIKSTLLKAKETISETRKLIRDGSPILTKTSWLLGKDKPRTYLMIFQNDAELRPTGGFWTAYGLLKVTDGKFTPLGSDDIYSLDAKFNSTIPAPRPIKAYHINVPYFNLRDMNISPDFPTSIKEFMVHYNKITGNKDKIDAVVALDTNFLVDLVKVLGRVGVSGFGNFSAEPDKRCDGCPQIIYQLEWIAGRPRNYIETDRKGFLGPLMNSLLSNAMGSEKSKIGPLAQAGFDNIFQKHILFYFIDSDMQNAAELANIGGKIVDPGSDVDYFHLNDANMSSAKTNLFLRQKIKHEIISKDGKVEHKITVTYINPSKGSNCNLEKGDLCLNASKYRNWFRFYVPKGSTMVKMTGSEVEPVLYEELGKQVFEGFYGNRFFLAPESSVKTSIQYTSSIPASSNYTLYLQKQPGTKATEYDLTVNGKKQDTFSWVADKTIKLAL